MPVRQIHVALLIAALALVATRHALAQRRDETVRVFIFAGQSNMEGADSHVEDVDRFPPYVGVAEPRDDVRFHYSIGRENRTESDGWVALQPVRGMVGPELSFAARVTERIDAPLAIIKVAAGGTHLGGDWNPDEPSGFEMYPRLLGRVRDALERLDTAGVPYRLEAFVWHQGENDMFDPDYMANYGKNLARFVACCRRDLDAPELRFQIGELCTKTIWGMDLRPRMYAIRGGQRTVTGSDPRAEYVPTSHVGVEIGGGVGLHYHYGTLGQLQHGASHAESYLRHVGRLPERDRPLRDWPYPEGGKVKLFVLAGHRNMEGERAFARDLEAVDGGDALREDVSDTAFRYDIGGGFRVSKGWEPLGPAGFDDTFGPELSFAAELRAAGQEDFAIAKFTHSGSQIVDWTPAGSEAVERNLYEPFLAFVRGSIASLEERGHDVELAGIFYHVGENDMSWGPARKQAADRLGALVAESRVDLDRPELRWFVSQQEPTDDPRVATIDVVATMAELAEADPFWIPVPAFDLPGREEQLVITAPGIVELGRRMAGAWLDADRGR